MEPSQDPKGPTLTVADLDFLVRNKVALRFQHQKVEEDFLQAGVIQGDAYSLAHPASWEPATDQKAAYFGEALHALMDRVFGGFMASFDDYDGTLSLIADVNGAARPVTDKGSYIAPFYPVGAGTHFNLVQRIGTVQLTRSDIESHGFDRNVPDPKPAATVVQSMAAAVIRCIKDAHANELTPGAPCLVPRARINPARAFDE